MTLTEPLVVQRDGCSERLLLSTLIWPDRIGFTAVGLHLIPLHRWRIRKGHLDIALDNGRAVYRIDRQEGERFYATCVYSEMW